MSRAIRLHVHISECFVVNVGDGKLIKIVIEDQRAVLHKGSADDLAALAATLAVDQRNNNQISIVVSDVTDVARKDIL